MRMFKNKQAGKAFNRLMSDWQKLADEQESVDAHFDGGEWSGPAWGRMYDAREKSALNLVARRFNITTDDVWHAAQDLVHGGEQRKFEATTPWEPWTDENGKRRHGRVCHEHFDRGLNCSCIPEAENQRISAALARGDDADDVIGPGWGQF